MLVVVRSRFKLGEGALNSPILDLVLEGVFRVRQRLLDGRYLFAVAIEGRTKRARHHGLFDLFHFPLTLLLLFVNDLTQIIKLGHGFADILLLTIFTVK